MTRIPNPRALLFRLALSLLVVGSGVFLSPLLVRSSYASDGEVTCTATCKNGSCTGNQEYCVCSCSFWTSSAVCSCAKPEEDHEVKQST